MNAGIKTTLIGLAAGAFGLTMVGCGGSSAEPAAAAPEATSGGEAAAGEHSCNGTAKPADGTAPAAGADAGAGGEHSCGQGSCGGKQ